MYSVRVQGLPTRLRNWRLVLPVALVALVTGCDIEWGGATVHLEDPSPPPPEAPAQEAAAEVVAPLPQGPLVWVVRSTGPGGEALALPVARLEDGQPADLGFPDPPPEDYRARFDSAFAVDGSELVLGADGIRLGTLVLTGSRRTLDAGCPSAASARGLVLPGAELPPVFFAVGPGLAFGDVTVSRPVAVDNRMRTFGPILAEQLLRQGGEDRPYLAQRADLVAVYWPGDDRPAMAATYLINDAFGGAGPSGSATSLFFLARFGSAGYAADWSEMRRYSGGGGSREIFSWVGAAPLPEGRLDFAARRDGAARRLVASVDSEDAGRGIGWTEAARCPSLELLEVADRSPAPATPPASAAPTQEDPAPAASN
jgi:hypothetical protein